MSIKLEKRRFPRITLKSPLRCQIRGEKEAANIVSSDIGLGGLSCINERFVSPNTFINLELKILNRVINPIGRVVRSNPVPFSDKYQMGIEFLEIDFQQKKLLSDYINMQLQRC